jgi:O-6-methylguanine DNA methyltransferase
MQKTQKKASPADAFRERVLDIVRKIPEGKAMTYKEVAIKAGNPNAARAVGAIMRTNYRPDVPCHRVVRSDGSPSGYNRGGWEAKAGKLRAEGYGI